MRALGTCAGDCHAATSPAPVCCPSAQVLPTCPLALLADRSAHPLGRPPRPPSGRSPRPPSCRPPSFLSYSDLHPHLFRHCDRHYPPHRHYPTHATAVADTIPRFLSSLHGGGGESLYDGPDGVFSRLTSGGGDWVGLYTGAVWRVRRAR